jgi:hypothetical protein
MAEARTNIHMTTSVFLFRFNIMYNVQDYTLKQSCLRGYVRKTLARPHHFTKRGDSDPLNYITSVTSYQSAGTKSGK